jgi:uncharacterized membrane protein
MSAIPWNTLVNGALIAVGALAIIDNVVFHWLLGFHRLIEGWDYNLYGEAFLVALGVAMIALGVARERRRRPAGDR